MTQGFDKDYWESHWQHANERGGGRGIEPNPYLAQETGSLIPGTALDAGCGEGAEAIWLATAGWQVIAVDISSQALSRASESARTMGAADSVLWIETDLSSWEPGRRFDLVTTHYAHPAMPQLAFYERISDWVAPGGTLLVVGHLSTATASPSATDHGNDHGHGQDQDQHDHGHPPEKATATAASITAVLHPIRWDVVTADERVRAFTDPAGRALRSHDVIVRATRRP